MDEWTARFKDHRIFPTLSQLGPLIDQAVRTEAAKADPVAYEGLERLRAILTLIGKRLDAMDGRLVPIGLLDPIARQMEDVVTGVRDYGVSPDRAQIVNANSAADAAVERLADLVFPLGVEELAGQRSILQDYRLAISQEVERLREETRLALTETQELKAILELIRSEGKDQQSTITNAIVDLRDRFERAESDRQKAFDKLQDDNQQRMNELIEAYSKDRIAAYQSHERALESLRVGYEERAKERIDHIKLQSDEVDLLVASLAQRGIASDYLQSAGQAKTRALVWQTLTVLSFLGVLGVGWKVFLTETSPDSLTWPGLVARVILMAAAGLLAAFCSSQVRRYLRSERYNHQRGVELAALGPFLSKLPQSEQDALRKRVGEIVFRGGEDQQGDEEASPTSAIGLILLNRQVETVLKRIPEIIKAVKGAP